VHKVVRGGKAFCPFQTSPPKEDKQGRYKTSFHDERDFSPTEVSNFYNNSVRKQEGCLEVLVSRAKRLHTGFRAPAFFVTCQLLLWFLMGRQEAFYGRVRAFQPQAAIFKKRSLENVHRMFDRGTWHFIGHARAFAGGLRKGSMDHWRRVVCWVLRVEFTNHPRPFAPDKFLYVSAYPERDEDFNRKAYNHCCGNNETLVRRWF
jgi:hypothetical protein